MNCQCFLPGTNFLTLPQSCVKHAGLSVCALVSTCVCRLLSVPAGGSSSWPCIRPPSASVPPQCTSVWAGVCTCSRGSAPGAAGSASPVLHSKAASPGWTWPSTWNLKTHWDKENEFYLSLILVSYLNLSFNYIFPLFSGNKVLSTILHPSCSPNFLPVSDSLFTS